MLLRCRPIKKHAEAISKKLQFRFLVFEKLILIRRGWIMICQKLAIILSQSIWSDWVDWWWRKAAEGRLCKLVNLIKDLDKQILSFPALTSFGLFQEKFFALIAHHLGKRPLPSEAWKCIEDQSLESFTKSYDFGNNWCCWSKRDKDGESLRIKNASSSSSLELGEKWVNCLLRSSPGLSINHKSLYHHRWICGSLRSDCGWRSLKTANEAQQKNLQIESVWRGMGLVPCWFNLEFQDNTFWLSVCLHLTIFRLL